MSLAALTLLLLAPAPVLEAQDQMVLVSGKILDVQRVTSETYREVQYRTLTGAEARKPADQVREVIHDLSPRPLADYARALELIDNGDYGGAADVLQSVLSSDVVRSSRYGWVKQHALYRLARVRFSLGDTDGVAAAVDTLLKEVPDSFFHAPALMLKARALASADKSARARQTWEQLASDVENLGLPEVWAREAELGLVLLDEALTGKALEMKLQELIRKNERDFPMVANRARVEIGKALLEAGDVAGAESHFRRILDSGIADDWTEAAAWAGIGDVAYSRGMAALEKGDEKTLDAAFLEGALANLRVVTLYREQAGLATRSLYYAAMCLERRGDDESRKRARILAGVANNRYRNSPWTARLFQDLHIAR